LVLFVFVFIQLSSDDNKQVSRKGGKQRKKHLILKTHETQTEGGERGDREKVYKKGVKN